MPYSVESIREAVAVHEKRYMTAWSAGRPEGWAADTRTRDTICLGMWLNEEMTRIGLNDDDRKTQNARFHRESRSENDLWQLAVDVLHQAVSGDVPQNRVPHHRWG